MPGILISLREFLKSGRFGPVTPDLCLLDVAKSIGAPGSFLTENDRHIPTYWRYGKFEIAFEEKAPHRIRFYQIEWASYLEGEYELLKEDIVLLLEGFHGSSSPSELLLSGLWDVDDVVVNIGALADDVRINICAGPVVTVFEVDAGYVEDGDVARYLEITDVGQVVRDVDHRTEINCIEVGPSAASQLADHMRGHCRHMSGREYLGLLGLAAPECA